jgi:adenosylcobinamide-phosphate synthase
MSAGAVVVAAILDKVLGEPPVAHPVRAMGRYLDRVGRLMPAAPPARAVVRGAAGWAAGAVAVGALGLAVERAVAGAPPWRRALVRGVALWPLFAHRLLLDEVSAVEVALAGSLEEGRAAVARIVSRDTSRLSGTQVRQAAVESLAENLSDSVVAPLLWFAVGGLPAAALYRYANTADAMWGYRTARWRHAGMVAARADDLLNLVPARLTAVALAPGRVPGRLGPDARRTTSPNAGWPMAALALRLDIRLAKPGTYLINPAGRPPTAADTAAALRLVSRRGWALIAICALLAGRPRRSWTLRATRRATCPRTP